MLYGIVLTRWRCQTVESGEVSLSVHQSVSLSVHLPICVSVCSLRVYFKPIIQSIVLISKPVFSDGVICGIVEAHWTAGQQVERSILHQGHDS